MLCSSAIVLNNKKSISKKGIFLNPQKLFDKNINYVNIQSNSLT